MKYLNKKNVIENFKKVSLSFSKFEFGAFFYNGKTQDGVEFSVKSKLTDLGMNEVVFDNEMSVDEFVYYQECGALNFEVLSNDELLYSAN